MLPWLVVIWIYSLFSATRSEKKVFGFRNWLPYGCRTANVVYPHPPYSEFHLIITILPSCERSARGGIDWYRYNRCILQPLLLPAYQKFKASHANRTLLMQDEASNHTSQWNRPLFMKQEIDMLFWPGNSPDLNLIEHIWNLIKDRVSRRRLFIKDRLKLKLIWYDEWEKLNIENNINSVILNQKHRMDRIILKQSDNHFHE